MSDPWGVSIIVVSYNNERFLAAAIDAKSLSSTTVRRTTRDLFGLG